jgi:uncharacterized protein (DUF433 family)
MDKALSSIKQRVLEFLGKQKIKKENFFSSTGIVRSNFGGANAKSELGGDKIAKILTTYPDLNPAWLLTGKGDMLLAHTHSARENWIDSGIDFSTARHSFTDLLQVGVRIDEICYAYGITHEQLAKATGFGDNELAQIVSGNKPAPLGLLQKIEAIFVSLSHAWLYCGKGSMHTAVCMRYPAVENAYCSME